MQISLENAQKLGNTDQVQELQELLQFLDQEIEETVLRLTSNLNVCLQINYFFLVRFLKGEKKCLLR